MNNYITLYGEPLEYPHQVSVDKRGVAYYGFNMATERVSGIKDITQVIVEEGTPAFESLTAIDQVKDLLDCKLLVNSCATFWCANMSFGFYIFPFGFTDVCA